MNNPDLSRYRRVLVAGASGGIARAIIEALQTQNGDNRRILALSRSPQPGGSGVERLQWSPNDPGKLTAELNALDFRPDLVIAAMGMLHNESRGPEKKLAEFNPQWCEQSMWANCYSHLSLASALEPLLQKHQLFSWLSLSAMVGSIGDNNLGGWYSYRMSKAALNMAMKNLSIEWRRRFPNASVCLVHPGTTDTPLSQPFQRNIPGDRLYNTGQTAHRILQIAAQMSPQESGSFYHWDGSRLPW